MINITNKKCTYKFENGDEYIVSQEDGFWKLHVIDKNNKDGKYITKNKDINKIFDRIPEGMA